LTQRWCRICDIVQCFEFFDKEIIEQIVRETNRYAEQYKNARGNLFSFTSLLRSWTPVTESEIYTILGLFLLMGILQKPTARLYFSKRRVISTPGFADVISRERFELICKFFAFHRQRELTNISRTSHIVQNLSCDMSFEIKFQTLYLPNQNIAIDEA